jgi:capsular exopolysaccharide synthesis family protein
MSHVRNLLLKPVGHAHELPPAHLEAVAGKPSDTAAPPHIPDETAGPALPADIPVEEAYLKPESRIVLHSDPASPAADRFRFLRMRLREIRKTGKPKSLLVTSPLANDGKSTVTANLATALAEQGKKSVLVVEADLHHASLARLLGLRRWPGLAECLEDASVSPFAGIRRIEPLQWSLLPAGECRGNPADLLHNPRFGHVVDTLSSGFDWILIDSPPALDRPDALSLQQHAEATILVMRAGATTRTDVDQAVALLGRKKIVALVLNGAEDLVHSNYRDEGAKHAAEPQTL